jgi:multidrug transporter EmrE-like cation transporter
MIATIVYILCALTSGVCAALLLRRYSEQRLRLLLWSGLCFVGLALNNVMLIIDVRVIPDVDLSVIRTIPAVVGIALLVYGLVWESA